MSERTVLVQSLQDQRYETKPLDILVPKSTAELHNMGTHPGFKKEERESQ